MPKNIIIYSDGTGQAGGLRPEQCLSNIYKMYRASRVGPDSPIDPMEQFAFYDAGLGSGEHESFGSHPIKSARKLLSVALGSGISANIADCYEAIIKNYEEGDFVYLFGFSRGAYTVRCVANVMNICGIPTYDVGGVPLPRYGTRIREIAEEAVFRVYEHGASKNRKLYEDEREEQGRRFREKYGSEGKGADGEAQGNIQPYFVGVFDTVAALGTSMSRKALSCVLVGVALTIPSIVIATVVWFFSMWAFWPTALLIWALSVVLTVVGAVKSRFRYIRNFPNEGDFNWHIKSWGLANYDRFLDNLVPYARHAISIDETRRSFPRVSWVKQEDMDRNAGRVPPWIRQVWFAGSHSDIGGSYPENESRLSDVALDWMIEQIKETPRPILFNNDMLHRFPMANAMQHSEVVSLKESWPRWIPRWLRFTWKETARDGSGAGLHDSVLERFKLNAVNDAGRNGPYRPEALKDNPHVKDFYVSKVV